MNCKICERPATLWLRIENALVFVCDDTCGADILTITKLEAQIEEMEKQIEFLISKNQNYNKRFLFPEGVDYEELESDLIQ